MHVTHSLVMKQEQFKQSAAQNRIEMRARPHAPVRIKQASLSVGTEKLNADREMDSSRLAF